jgi:hypothetical protein
MLHHSDSTVACPGCGRRFRTHVAVAEGGGRVSISFKSKHTKQWGAIRIPSDAVAWAGSYTEAWKIKDAEQPPFG